MTVKNDAQKKWFHKRSVLGGTKTNALQKITLFPSAHVFDPRRWKIAKKPPNEKPAFFKEQYYVQNKGGYVLICISFSYP